MPPNNRSANLYLKVFLAGVAGAYIGNFFLVPAAENKLNLEKPRLFDEAYRVVMREHLHAQNLDKENLQRIAIKALVGSLDDKYANYKDRTTIRLEQDVRKDTAEKDKKLKREYVHVQQFNTAPTPMATPAPGAQTPGIAYLKIDTFDLDDIAGKVEKKLLPLTKKRPKGLVIDLRDNKGGWTNIAADVAGIFLPKDTVVVYFTDKKGKKSSRKSTSTLAGKLERLPIAVLVNGSTASASELVAGALRDVRKAPLVGQKTFGKGIAQDHFTLSDGSQLKLTTFDWLTPSGYSIQGDGLEPDVTVVIAPGQIKSGQVIPGTPGQDPQLDAAIELLQKLP